MSRSILFAAVIGAALHFSPIATAEIAVSAERVRPLLIGAALPQANLRDSNGKLITLAQIGAGKPTVMVFYRGGWCPYCNTQLADLRKLIEPLKARGVQLVAISPDQPKQLFKSIEKAELDYQLYSDSAAQAIEGFGIGFKLDDGTLKKYADYGIDLEQSSGEKHHVLPVPSVFLIDAGGVVQFSYVNPDYRVRVSSEVILAAVDALLKKVRGSRE